jgi:integrase
MAVVSGKRRGRGEDSIFWDDSKDRYVGVVSLGYSPSGTRVRKKVMGRTKIEVREKLRELHAQVESAVRPRRHYTVNDALDDWLETGLDGLAPATFVWRAERAGGDTKTPESRRTLALPRRCVEALREHRVRQAEDRLAAGPLWQDHGLVFASTVGTPQDDHNVRRQFRVITEAAELGNRWVPRELRHTFVSLLSAHGVPVEAIALLAGHNQTATTELVYRHQIVPALTRGAEVMDEIFG